MIKKETILSEKQLFADLVRLIESGKTEAARQVNSALTLTYWHIGKRINDDVLQNQRAEYGKQIVLLLATQLVERFGKSFEARNLRRMMQFAELFPNIEIVSPLVTQLSWTHFRLFVSVCGQKGIVAAKKGLFSR